MLNTSLLFLSVGLHLAELILIAAVLWKRSVDRRPRASAPPSAPPASSPERRTAGPALPEEDKKALEAEKRRQEAIDDILSYDMTRARAAAGRDDDEE